MPAIKDSSTFSTDRSKASSDEEALLLSVFLKGNVQQSGFRKSAAAFKGFSAVFIIIPTSANRDNSLFSANSAHMHLKASGNPFSPMLFQHDLSAGAIALFQPVPYNDAYAEDFLMFL